MESLKEMQSRHEKEIKTMQAKEKSLAELRKRIREERPNVDKKNYSHNIISLTLREIAIAFMASSLP